MTERTTLAEHRAMKDRFFAEHPQSPLPDHRKADFSGLPYFPETDTLRFTVDVVPEDPVPVAIGTTTGDDRTYHRVASVEIPFPEGPHTVALYDTGHDGYFLPFRDATSGGETYGAGRYLDLQPNPDGTVTIDFNYAYAPFCAYNDAYSCALPPAENWLAVPIRAGERNPPE